MGLPYTEDKLIGYAYAFEQLTRVRDQGKQVITPTTELEDVLDCSSCEASMRNTKSVGGVCLHLRMTSSYSATNAER